MIDTFLEKLYRSERLAEHEVEELCKLASDVLVKEDNVININGPITICGDVHGQFYDLLELFKVGGMPPFTTYLFMGDYVDRGYHSVETISTLLCLKVKYPTRIFLLRGNHESRQITQVYGFYDECMRKYASINVWKYFTDVFDYFPISAIVNNDTFCCHGGLSPSFETINQLKKLDRRVEVPHDGVMCDLLWSDPDEKKGWGISPRGAGYTFGPDVTNQFTVRNNLKMICRAHQVVMDGYSWNHNKACVTIFSAPNYCYRCGNLATLMQIDESGSCDFTQFEPSPVKMEEVVLSKIPDYFL